MNMPLPQYNRSTSKLGSGVLAPAGAVVKQPHAAQKGLIGATVHVQQCRTVAQMHNSGHSLRRCTVLHAASTPQKTASFPVEATLAWLLYAGYLYFLLFSPLPPGEPAIHADTAALAEIVHESSNLFYLNIFLDSMHLTPIPSVAEHPVAESLFNIIMSWSVMLLPAMLADERSKQVPKRYLQWAINVLWPPFALMPFLAQRAATDPVPSIDVSQPPLDSGTPAWQRSVGVLGLVVGTISLGWWALGRPEYGDIADRVVYFTTRASTQRVFWGYVGELGIFWLAQWLLMRGSGASKAYSATPFFGLGAWLAVGMPREAQKQD